MSEVSDKLSETVLVTRPKVTSSPSRVKTTISVVRVGVFEASDVDVVEVAEETSSRAAVVVRVSAVVTVVTSAATLASGVADSLVIATELSVADSDGVVVDIGSVAVVLAGAPYDAAMPPWLGDGGS